MFIILLIIGFFIFIKQYFFSYSRPELIKLLNSENVPDVLVACNYIVNIKDTSYYTYLLKKPYQLHNSFDLRCYGSNGYICKMKALEKLSGIESPKKLSDYHTHTDTTIAEFYRKKLQN